MYLPYSKCSLEKRCVIKTNFHYVFIKFTLLYAIFNYKYVGMTKEKICKIPRNKYI